MFCPQVTFCLELKGKLCCFVFSHFSDTFVFFPLLVGIGASEWEVLSLGLLH